MREYIRRSKYYPGCDGTRLAVDLYLPVMENGEKVPVIFQCGYFDRRRNFEMMREAFERIIDAGYAVALVEPRGNGASYGVSEGFFTTKDAKDLKAVIDTIAAEEWCTGKAGSFGGSNLGGFQQIVAAQNPKALKAVVPCDCNANFYYQNFPNGASCLPVMPRHHDSKAQIGTPVDDDPAPDYPMATEACEQHARNLGFLEQYVPNMFRDDVNPVIGYAPNLEIPTWERMDNIRFGEMKIYQNAAWFDPGCTGELLAYKSWGGKLLLGPWTHCEIMRGGSDYPNGRFDWVSEHIRFFDAVLKDKDNGALTEPPIYYYTIGDEPGREWHYAADFPLDSQTQPELYFHADGALSEDVPDCGTVRYQVVRDASPYPGMGRMMRRIQTPMNEIDEKSIVFTTGAFDKDVEITGVPVVELYVTSTYKDGNFIAFLEEVTADGTSKYITDGAIRASHGAISSNREWDSLGLPYHRGFRKDAIELSDHIPTQLAFNLEVTSYIVKAGSRLRVSIHCDSKSYSQPEDFPDEMPVVTFHVGGDAASLIRLPVIKPNVTEFDCNDGVKVYAFKRGVYINSGGKWENHPCIQVCPKGNDTIFVTEKFTAVKTPVEGGEKLVIDGPDGYKLTGFGKLPDRKVFLETSTEIKKTLPDAMKRMFKRNSVTRKNLYVASVPVGKEVRGEGNPQPVSTLDLHIDLILPDTGADKYPCIICIHGFGGNNHMFDRSSPEYLKRGYAVASVDYRLSPPSRWPACGYDVKGAIRYLKAHAAELKLDPDRFGVMGGSMGGHLTMMIAACNGDPSSEGDIGGNTEYDSSVKAAAASFGFSDFFGFGDDCAAVWPLQPDKVASCDGPYAPLGSMLGYVGPGKGMGELKKHLYDKDPYYQALIELAKDASPISHVTEKSAPTVLVHGIYECGVQVPMGQSTRMFEALTRKGVKSLLLCNNNCIYGEDPEVAKAVVEFMCNRI